MARVEGSSVEASSVQLRPVRVLLIEDDQNESRFIRALFDEFMPEQYQLDCAASLEEGLQFIGECRHDVYLVDYRLGDRSGLTLLMQARALGCRAPIIILTGQHEREVDLRAMQAGADDFLVKGSLDAVTIERAIRYALAQRRLEEEIRQANLQLERRVEQRTAELNEANAALQAEIAERKRAEQALREADRRKDEFLATLAHELRNPLAPLTAAVQLIAAEPANTEQVGQLMEMMSQQLDQLVRLIGDLVDVSRITGGKLQLRCEPTEIAEIVQAAIDQSRPLIEASGHAFHVSLAPGPLVVNGDKVRLAQIVSNLLINAAKYTPHAGNIELCVEPEGRDVVIAVRDNGIGIPPQMLARIFDLFAQVDSSTTRTHGGLGIGLTIVKTLVEMHGGTIRAASQGQDRGSEFSVRLPMMSPVPRAPSEESTSLPPLPGLTVLLVDDNQSAVHMMSRLLQKLGQDVHVAECGQEALDQVPHIAPHIVISDVAMPGMSGYELARHIRELSLPRRPYLVAVTGYGQESDRQEALAAGFDKHLTKPVGVSTLEQLLRSRGGRT
jgi:signal transduction histidine kinase